MSEYWKYKKLQSKIGNVLFPAGGRLSARDHLLLAQGVAARGTFPGEVFEWLDTLIRWRTQVAQRFSPSHPDYDSHLFWIQTMKQVRQILKLSRTSWPKKSVTRESVVVDKHPNSSLDHSHSQTKDAIPRLELVDAPHNQEQELVIFKNDEQANDNDRITNQVDRILFFDQLGQLASQLSTLFQQMLVGELNFAAWAIGNLYLRSKAYILTRSSIQLRLRSLTAATG